MGNSNLIRKALESGTTIPVPPCLPIRSDQPRRLVNHFKVGADPEFHLVDLGVGERVYASRFVEAGGSGIYGADGSGRQAELRAWPSRSVLEVVASLGEAMRAFYTNVPAVQKLAWLPLAYYAGDGCGGHVHFGRRRPLSRGEETARLDLATQALLEAGLLHKKGQEQRIAETRYGRYGDVRMQPFGYEYRTMPVWLQSPATAHCVLTAAKLAVLHSGPLPYSREGWALFFRLYAGKDDDARLAQYALPWITATSPNCCRPFWGLTKPNPVPLTAALHPPSSEVVRAVEISIRTGSPVEWPDEVSAADSAPSLLPVEGNARQFRYCRTWLYCFTPWPFRVEIHDESACIVSLRFLQYTNSLWKRVFRHLVGDYEIDYSNTFDFQCSPLRLQTSMYAGQKMLPVTLNPKPNRLDERVWNETWHSNLKWEELYVRNRRRPPVRRRAD